MSILPTPFLKSFVGFDELFDELSKLSEQKPNSYPAYDIIKCDDQNYEIKIAIAGFGQNDLEVLLENDFLSVKGKKNMHDRTEEILHKGIATRSFEKRFTLGPTIEIIEAILKDGILSIKLFKNPSKKIFKKIDIKKI